MKNVIAVIDDGINEKLYNTSNLIHNIEVTPGLEILERVDYDPYLTSHGTTCAAIINKYASQAALCSVKILNDEARGVRKQLISAIKWCVDNGIRLVNLSLGTIDYRDFDEIREMVNYVYSNGIIIVAACNNSDIFTYPASLSNVIGVKCDKNGCLKKGEYAYNHYTPDGVEITACGRHSLMKYTGRKRITTPSNSFAAPFVTALVYGMMMKSPGITLEEIKEELRKGANNSEEDYRPFLYKNIDWVEKSVVFNLSRSGNLPYNMRYSFETTDFININCDCISEGLNRVKEIVCKNTLNLFGAETIVVAVNDGELTHSGIAVRNFFETLSSCGKNIVYINNSWLEDDINIKKPRKNVKIWHPVVSRHFNNHQKTSVEIDVPVIAVYDFSGNWLINAAGSLLDCFKQDGYNAVVCTDTCSGVVAGFEYAPLNINRDASDILWLKCIYNVYDPDVIILGISAAGHTAEYLKKLEKLLEIDVRIRLVENPGNSMDEVSVDNESKEITIDLPDIGLINNLDQQTVGSRLFENEHFQELYRRVINLFEQ